jgi:hypothetical protein
MFTVSARSAARAIDLDLINYYLVRGNFCGFLTITDARRFGNSWLESPFTTEAQRALRFNNHPFG